MAKCASHSFTWFENGNSSFRIACALRLGSPLCHPHQCICCTWVDSSGVHGLSCKKSAGRFTRHTHVNNLIKRALECAHVPTNLQGDPKRCVPIKISVVTLIKKLFISNYNHTLFSLWKTIYQSFSYFCPFLGNLWLFQDVFQMSTISLQANLYSSGKVVNDFYTLLFRDGSYFCCDGSFQFLNCLRISLVYIVFEETPQIKIWGGVRSGEYEAHSSSHLLMSLSSNLCLNQARILLAV